VRRTPHRKVLNLGQRPVPHPPGPSLEVRRTAPRLQSSHGSRRCTCGRGAPRVCGGGVLARESPPWLAEVLHLRTETGVVHTRQTWETVRCFPHARRRARKDAARSALGRGAARTREVGGRPCIRWTLSVREARPTHRHRAERFLVDQGRNGCLAHASLRGWPSAPPPRPKGRGAPRRPEFGGPGRSRGGRESGGFPDGQVRR